jgi:hypothetical protein
MNDQETSRQRPVPVWVKKGIQEVLWRAVASDQPLLSSGDDAGRRRTQTQAQLEDRNCTMDTGFDIALSLWEYECVPEVL